jgi:hypothetical protein
MSCPCPSGYTPTIDSDACILTITAATSGGSYFYTATTGSQNNSYCVLGAIFYEDVTNLSFPITNSGTTGTVSTENGTLLTNTQFLIDNSGRILNIQVGGTGCFPSPPNPTPLQNQLWGQAFPAPPLGTYWGRLNNAGVWVGTPPNPINEWLGFSYCLDIPSGGTYFIGFAADNEIELRINNNLIFETSPIIGVNPCLAQGLIINTWSILPYTFSSGLNIIEMKGLNYGSDAAFAFEIYSGSVSTLSGYTNTTQLSADTIFSTLDLIGQEVPLSTSGYSCPSGYTLYTCSGSPYCVFIDKTDIVNYCISNTGLGYDDNFKYGGDYNGYPYWLGESTGYFIFFSNDGTWCMSSSLGGTCFLEGPYPCNSSCPDLCDTYVFSGTCPTPTPTPTVNCSVLDFNAVFDCDFIPTPTPTPTVSVSPTTTPTPTSSNPCSIIVVDVTITGYTPTPTPTITTTPTPTPQITRPFSVSGSVSFNTINGEIKCPNSKQFQDCFNGEMFYTTNNIPLPSGGSINQFMIFKADVNGVSKCISFVGYNLDTIGVDDINLIDGPLGYSNLGECVLCTPNVSPTPTPTVTPSITPTITPSPTPSMTPGYYVYRQCGNPTEYIIQTLGVPTFILGDVFKTTDNNYCWEFMYYSATYPTLPLGSTFTFISGSFFPYTGNTFFNDCSNCLSSL